MNKLLMIILIFYISNIFGQSNQKIIEGEVTFISSQNFYVKYENTSGLKIGDTLFVKRADNIQPIGIIEYLSSKSSACKKLNKSNIVLGTKVICSTKNDLNSESVKKDIIVTSNKQVTHDDRTRKSKSKIERAGKFNGRFAVSSYSNISTTGSSDFMRWRYTFAGSAENINNSRFSINSYISFNYRSTEWNMVKNDIYSALKVYSFGLKYDISDKFKLTIGRNINRHITNIGAIDGLQFQAKLSTFTTGLVVGSRPDFKNYTVNLKLFEYGGFVNHSDKVGYGLMRNSIAFFEQTNEYKTDRRFVYFQHNNNLIKSINIFFSSEVDLYKKENGAPKSTFTLTGIYFSLLYRPIREISFTGSYDSRRNVIYYETFQNYADSIYENATRQGFNLSTNIRPLNKLNIRLSYGHRNRDGDINPSYNYSGNISYSKIPIIDGTLGFNYNNLFTSYLNGKIWGIYYSQNLFLGDVFCTLNYKKIDYSFNNIGSNLIQNIIALDLSWRIARSLSVSISSEATFEQNYNYNRIFFNLTKRF